MKVTFLFTILLLLGNQLYSQTISGRIINSSTGDPLIYAGIGVIGTMRGTISDEHGSFNLDIKDLPSNSIVRFSMIGFKSQSFSIEELAKTGKDILLENQTYQLSEIVIRPLSRPSKIGTSGYSPMGGVCGLAGQYIAQGYEIGTKLELGDSPIRIKSLHIRVHEQSFDSSLFRFHVRDLADSIPGMELLKKDILFSIIKESGWIEIDLSKHNLVFKNDIAISIEWIKVFGADKQIEYKSGGVKYSTPVIFFSIKNNDGCLFTKWGIEGKWSRNDGQSPSFYLTVQ